MRHSIIAYSQGRCLLNLELGANPKGLAFPSLMKVLIMLHEFVLPECRPGLVYPTKTTGKEASKYDKAGSKPRHCRALRKVRSEPFPLGSPTVSWVVSTDAFLLGL